MQTRQHSVDEFRPHSTRPRSIPVSNSRGSLQQWLHPPTDFASALAEAIAWIGAAMAVRLVMGWLLASSTAFWTPVLIGIMAPAAIAVTLSIRMPQLSVVLGYRLILVMFGLLLGGKL